jgi:hypothetical protein
VNLSSFDFLNSSMGAGHTRLRLQTKLTTGEFMSRLSHSGYGVLSTHRELGRSTLPHAAMKSAPTRRSSADVEHSTAAAPVLGSMGRECSPF